MLTVSQTRNKRFELHFYIYFHIADISSDEEEEDEDLEKSETSDKEVPAFVPPDWFSIFSFLELGKASTMKAT